MASAADTASAPTPATAQSTSHSTAATMPAKATKKKPPPPPRQCLVDRTITPTDIEAARSRTTPLTILCDPAAPKARVKSKTLFTDIATAPDATAACEMAASVVALWNGKGLRPLTAIRALALFPSTFNEAVNYFFQVVYTSSKTMIITNQGFWRSLKNRRGKASGYFKTLDKALFRVVATEWVRVLRAGQEQNFNAIELACRIAACQEDLVKLYPARPLRTKTGTIRAADIKIFPKTRDSMGLMQQRRLAVVKINRIIGNTLPQELLDSISDQLALRAYSLFHASMNMVRRGVSRNREPVLWAKCESLAEYHTSLAKSVNMPVHSVKQVLRQFFPAQNEVFETYFDKLEKIKAELEA